jgi:hypothetical protein
MESTSKIVELKDLSVQDVILNYAHGMPKTIDVDLTLSDDDDKGPYYLYVKFTNFLAKNLTIKSNS